MHRQMKRMSNWGKFRPPPHSHRRKRNERRSLGLIQQLDQVSKVIKGVFCQYLMSQKNQFPFLRPRTPVKTTLHPLGGSLPAWWLPKKSVPTRTDFVRRPAAAQARILIRGNNAIRYSNGGSTPLTFFFPKARHPKKWSWAESCCFGTRKRKRKKHKGT